MDINGTITVGNIIEIGVLGVCGVGAIFAIKSAVGNMKEDLCEMKTEIKKVGEVLVKMAVHDARLSNVEQEVRDLRHGRGFITDRSQGGINGEYP